MRNFGEPLTDDEVDEILKAAEACEVRVYLFHQVDSHGSDVQVKKGMLDYRRFAKEIGLSHQPHYLGDVVKKIHEFLLMSYKDMRCSHAVRT
eukprot:760444-Hanusia_phi.AAC.6